MVTIKRCTLLEKRKTTTECWKSKTKTKSVVTYSKWRVLVAFPDPIIKGKQISMSLVIGTKNGQGDVDIFWRLADRYNKKLGPYWCTANVYSDTDGSMILSQSNKVQIRKELVSKRCQKIQDVANAVRKAVKTAIKVETKGKK